MRIIETRIKTSAGPEELWDVLMDFPSYPAWNPMVVEIKGQPELGRQLQTTIAMKSGRRTKFTPTVVEYEPCRRFAWLGNLWVRGLFDGLHRFAIDPNGEGATFIHDEEFRGLLPPLLGRLLKDTHDSLIEMNEALIQEVDRRHGVRTK